MALTVENGTNVAGADCYADVAACSAWAVSYYGSALTGGNSDKEAAIRRAAAYLDGMTWKGYRTYGRSQAMAWPRVNATDCEGLTIDDNAIPAELIFAQHVLARAEFQSPGVLTPSVNLGRVVLREKVDVIERDYDTSRLNGNADELRPLITMAIDRLKCLLAVQPGGRHIPWAAVV